MKRSLINQYGIVKFLIIALFPLSIVSCKKTDTLVTAPFEAHFTNKTGGSFSVTPASTQFKIPVGLTNVSDKDRVVTFTVTSPTGAVQGTHYSIVNGNSITIPAGKVLDSIIVNGVLSAYSTGRKDTLVFTITEPSVKVSSYNSVYKLFLRGPCFDSDIIFSQLLGNYTRTFENGTYGPYKTTITGLTSVSPTSATATITNIYDSGISAVALFDWSTVGAFRVSIAPQATTIGYNIRSTPATTGTFTFCTPAFSMTLELYNGAGIYDRWVMTMAR